MKNHLEAVVENMPKLKTLNLPFVHLCPQNFKEYAEDFNTATLPHEKYYNYDKWEMEEYQRQKEAAQKSSSGGSAVGKSDEFLHREEMKKKEEEKRKKEMDFTMSQMSKEKISEMRNQELLRHEMTQA